MRINSDFKDYYDYMCQYSTDYDTVYYRYTKVVEKFKYPFRIIDDGGVIYFAGKFYPFCIHHFYTYGLEHKIIKSFDKDYSVAQFNIWSADQARLFFEFHQNPSKELIEFADALGPIWKIDFTRYALEHDLTINPQLEKFQFVKNLPPHEAYNDLYKWFCNQARPTRPIPDMPNDIKIEQHGFHLKTSFRKDKSK